MPMIPYQSAPAHLPAKRALDHPAAWQGTELKVVPQLAYDFDDEIEQYCFIQQFTPVVRTIGKPMPQSRPALHDGIEHLLCFGRIVDVRRRQVDHQQMAFGIHRDMALTINNFLIAVVVMLGGARCLRALAVEYPSCRLSGMAGTLTVRRQRNIVDQSKQKALHETPEPLVHGLLLRKIVRQYAPLAFRASQVTGCVDDLAKCYRSSLTSFRFSRHQRSNRRPFPVHQIAWVPLQLRSMCCRTRPIFLCSHGNLLRLSRIRLPKCSYFPEFSIRL